VFRLNAGIGRTGTLLAVHSFLSRHAQDKLTVKQIVEDMRAHRMGMVQTKEQYLFIYQTIEDALNERSQMNGTPSTTLAAPTASAVPYTAAPERSPNHDSRNSWRTRSSPTIRNSAEITIPS
jgi:hypothetical protein